MKPPRVPPALMLPGLRRFGLADIALQDATRARLAKQPLFARLIAMLRESEGTLEDAEVLADLTIHFPFIPAEPLFATLVNRDRDAELLGHDPTAGRLFLLGWDGTAEPRAAG